MSGLPGLCRRLHRTSCYRPCMLSLPSQPTSTNGGVTHPSASSHVGAAAAAAQAVRETLANKCLHSASRDAIRATPPLTLRAVHMKHAYSSSERRHLHTMWRLLTPASTLQAVFAAGESVRGLCINGSRGRSRRVKTHPSGARLHAQG